MPCHFARSCPRLAALHAHEPWVSIGWGLACSDSRRPGDPERGESRAERKEEMRSRNPFACLGLGVVSFASPLVCSDLVEKGFVADSRDVIVLAAWVDRGTSELSRVPCARPGYLAYCIVQCSTALLASFALGYQSIYCLASSQESRSRSSR
ncbi:hypothetical protein ONS95_014559 [Cadophora gregata]|uniref:uncharacterized protein n=1 Tax=Cadophora gregata TaxID=51156 RepID=UPI0026DAA830|nr:uncharacterized protein ONS95_014559 [Cadophora gregata]KAK0112832.1 hypothetical protein ONS95_014559 [Cadophora gregata]